MLCIFNCTYFLLTVVDSIVARIKLLEFIVNNPLGVVFEQILKLLNTLFVLGQHLPKAHKKIQRVLTKFITNKRNVTINHQTNFIWKISAVAFTCSRDRNFREKVTTILSRWKWEFGTYWSFPFLTFTAPEGCVFHFAISVQEWDYTRCRWRSTLTTCARHKRETSQTVPHTFTFSSLISHFHD